MCLTIKSKLEKCPLISDSEGHYLFSAIKCNEKY